VAGTHSLVSRKIGNPGRWRIGPPWVRACAGPTVNMSMAWREVVKRRLADVGRKKLSLMAAAVAFYGMFSLAPCITALVSLYGLLYDPAAVEAQVAALYGIVPDDAIALISDELADIVSTSHSQLGIGLAVSMAIALGAAMQGTTVLMTALNVAYGEEEKRGLASYYASALLLAAGLLLIGAFSLALLAAMPAIVDVLPVGALGRSLVAWLRWPVLAVLAGATIAAIHRYAPSRTARRRRWVNWGTVAATALWIAGSALFSIYLHFAVHIGKFPSASETYGALGAVMALLTWLWLSAFAVLLGGALDARLEFA
jgi:membrane protein